MWNTASSRRSVRAVRAQRWCWWRMPAMAGWGSVDVWPQTTGLWVVYPTSPSCWTPCAADAGSATSTFPRCVVSFNLVPATSPHTLTLLSAVCQVRPITSRLLASNSHRRGDWSRVQSAAVKCSRVVASLRGGSRGKSLGGGGSMQKSWRPFCRRPQNTSHIVKWTAPILQKPPPTV